MDKKPNDCSLCLLKGTPSRLPEHKYCRYDWAPNHGCYNHFVPKDTAPKTIDAAPHNGVLMYGTSDNAVLLETIRDLAETRERLGRASGHITAARIRSENQIWMYDIIIRGYKDLGKEDVPTWVYVLLEDEKRYLAALVAAEKEIADE